MRRSVCNAGASNVIAVPLRSDVTATELPPASYWYQAKGNWMCYNFAADSFYIMKFYSRLLVLYCRNCPKDDKFRSLIPILNHCWWLVGTPVYDFLFVIIERFLLALTVDALQGKTCQNSLLLGGGGSAWAKISGGRGRPSGMLFGFYKTRYILLSDDANCTVLRAIVLTQYRRVTGGRTDGRADWRTKLL